MDGIEPWAPFHSVDAMKTMAVCPVLPGNERPPSIHRRGPYLFAFVKRSTTSHDD